MKKLICKILSSLTLIGISMSIIVSAAPSVPVIKPIEATMVGDLFIDESHNVYLQLGDLADERMFEEVSGIVQIGFHWTLGYFLITENGDVFFADIYEEIPEKTNLSSIVDMMILGGAAVFIKNDGTVWDNADPGSDFIVQQTQCRQVEGLSGITNVYVSAYENDTPITEYRKFAVNANKEVWSWVDGEAPVQVDYQEYAKDFKDYYIPSTVPGEYPINYGNYILKSDGAHEKFSDDLVCGADGRPFRLLLPDSIRMAAQQDIPAKTTTATPTSSKVLVNGVSVAFDAYLIDDSNYFKLRDLAYVIDGTAKQFEVSWDEAENAISLSSGQPYTVVGGEMEGKVGEEKTPIPTSAKILLDGTELSLAVYNIDGNNYFKLRDIGTALDFSVGWDDSENIITIETLQ